MSQYLFVTSNGKQITLGEKSNLIKVKIHDDAKAETPTSLAITYTAKVFKELGLTEKPDFEGYKSIGEAICQNDVLTMTELCSIAELVDKVWYGMN